MTSSAARKGAAADRGIAWVGAQELRDAISIPDAIQALDDALRRFGYPAAPERTHVKTRDGVLLTMPAAVDWAVGAKIVTIGTENGKRGLPLIQGVYVLFDGETLTPRAVFDAGELTAVRTAAVSALAADYLAPKAASRLVLFGAGRQARAHLDAFCLVRPLASVVVVEPRQEPAEALVDHARTLGLDARVGISDDVAHADIVCTCTTNSEPLFDGDLLPSVAYVNAVGAFQPAAREIDDATVRRARIVVEVREAAMAEAGDLLIPLASGAITDDCIAAELPDVVRAGRLAPDPDRPVVVFESLGHAFEDLVVADAALRAIDERDDSDGRAASSGVTRRAR